MSQRHDRKRLLYDYRRKVNRMYVIRKKQIRHAEPARTDNLVGPKILLSRNTPTTQQRVCPLYLSDVKSAFDGAWIKKRLLAERITTANTVRFKYAMTLGKMPKHRYKRIDVYSVDNSLFIVWDIDLIPQLRGNCLFYTIGIAAKGGFDGDSRLHKEKLLFQLKLLESNQMVVWQ